MKLVLAAAAAVLLFVAPVLAAPKPCDELKSEIEEKIKKNGVQSFTLEVVAKGDGAKSDAPKEGAKEADSKKEGAAGQGKVVGTCEGGTKQIVYKR